MPGKSLRVVIIGGSHAGLLAAIALDRIGCDVTVHERSVERLQARGAGLRIQPLMADLLRKAGIDLSTASTFTHFDRHIGSGNRILYNAPELGHFVSWGSLYRFLLERFGTARYRFGETCVDVAQRESAVEVRFAGGRTERADLAVFADGISSTGRRLLLGTMEPTYAGYVAWRGLVREADMSAATRAVLEDACTFTVAGLSHMPIYPVPGEDADNPDVDRLLNFIWYRNIAPGPDLQALMTDRAGVHRPISLLPGMVQPRFVENLKREAEAQLPPAAAEVLTKAPTMFIQPIFDLLSQPMVFGRCVLIGDAAAVTRPHVGAGTTKALLAAWELAEVIAGAGSELDVALAGWQDRQIALARDLIARGAMMGRRAQVEGTFTPGAPELSRITLAGGSGA